MKMNGISGKAVGAMIVAMTFVAGPTWSQSAASEGARSASASRLGSVSTIRGFVQTLGLNRQSDSVRFTKVRQTNDRAEFTGVSYLNSDQTRSTLGKLVIVRIPATDGNIARFDVFVEDISNGAARLERATFTGVRGNPILFQNLLEFNALNLSSDPSGRGPIGQGSSTIDLVRFEGVRLSGSPVAQTAATTLGALELRNVSQIDGKRRYDDFRLTDLAIEDPKLTMRLARFEMRGAADLIGLILAGRAQARSSMPAIDLNTASMAGFAMEGLTMSGRAGSVASAPMFRFELAQFSLDALRGGLLGAFGLRGAKFEVGEGAQVVTASLAGLSMRDLNLRYFSAFGDAFRASVRLPGRALAAQDPPNTPNSPSPTLAEILPGGPLDSGVGTFEMEGFELAGLGARFSMPQVRLVNERNNDGLITRAQMPEAQMILSWADKSSVLGAVLGQLSTPGEGDSITMRFGVDSRFDPIADRTTVSDYVIAVEGWGTVNIGFTLDGFQKLYAQTRMSDLLALASAGAAVTPRDRAEALEKITRFFGPLSLVTASAQVTDNGGLNKAANLSLTTRARPASASTVTPNFGSQMRQRETWASQARAQAADKTKPPLGRQVSLGLARWMEDSGTLRFEMQPAQPILISDILKENGSTLSSLGLRVSNSPAVPTVRMP